MRARTTIPSTHASGDECGSPPVSGNFAGVGSSVGPTGAEVGVLSGRGLRVLVGVGGGVVVGGTSVGVSVAGGVGVGGTSVGVGEGGFEGVREGTVWRTPL